MNQPDIPDTVVDGVKHGRYSLLLGAGFSKSSRTAAGRELPLGGELAQKLAQKYTLPENYALAQLADAIEDTELDQFLRAELKGCTASVAAKLVSSFVWRTIYTFNVDDVLDDCYRGKSIQKLTSLTFRHPYQRTNDPGSLYAIYLHGSVNRPKDGYVFSMQQYGSSVALGSTWFTVLGDELTTSPFIVVGCSLAEPDLEYYLAKRGGLTAEGIQLFPSVFVTRKLDRVLKKRCERFGLIAIESESDLFFQALSDKIGTRLTPLELIIPQLPKLFKQTPSERSLRVFYRQWLDASSPLPELNTTTVPSLLRGTEPHWEHLRHSQDIIRKTTKNFVNQITKWFDDADRVSRIEVLFSPSGEGRSTVMMRTFLELSRSGINTYYHLGQERLASSEAVEVFTSLKTPIILLVDSIAECAYQLAEMCESLQQVNVPFFVLGAERSYRRHMIETAFPKSLVESELKSLSRGEAIALVTKMRSEGLLGRNAHRADADLATSLQRRELFSAMISLSSGNRKLDAVIRSEWADLRTPEVRSVYSLISLAHYCGYPLRTALLSRAAGVSANQVTQYIQSDLKGMVTTLPPMGDYVETRHRRIAEELVRFLPATQKYRIFVNLARALAPYVNRKAIKSQSREARLAGRLLNFDDTVKYLLREESFQFYLDIKEDWEWNSRYWEQRALLELDREDDKAAISYAEQAVGIERHPLPLTTLAKIQFATAIRISDLNNYLTRVREAIVTVDEAIHVGQRQGWREPHPFDVGIRGIFDYLAYLRRRKVFTVDRAIKTKLKNWMADAERLYPKDDYAQLRDRYDELLIAFK